MLLKIKNTWFIFFVLFFTTFVDCSVSAQDPTVLVSLSSYHETTATPIEIVESVQMPAEHVAMMISHRVTRIGIFHRGLKRFVLWHGMILNGAKPVGLPQAEIGPHGIQMKELADGRLSKQYEFNVPDPGIYLLHTEWSLTTRDMNGKKPFVRKGNPVLFFVEPAADYELQATKRAGEFEGLNLQSYQEKLYDNSPSESGFVMPKFEESEF